MVDGSVWDYQWLIWGGGWKLWDGPYSSNDVALYDVEVIQFSDYEIVLGEEIPMEVLIAPPDQLTVEAGGEGSFDFVLRDMDDTIDVSIVTPTELAYGSVWIGSNMEESIYGENGQERSFTFYYDYDRYYNDFTDGPVEELAEGEEYVLPVTLHVKTSNFWLDADDPDRGEYYDLTFDLVIVGKNEAPEITGGGSLEAVEAAGEARFDLSALGYDIDSDDDGNTLTYEIVSSVGGLDVRVDGSELVLTANSLIDTATSDEFAVGEVVIRAVDSHGAVSAETVTIDLTVWGVDNTTPPPDYLLSDGGIDFDAFGVAGAPAFDFGDQIVSGWSVDGPTALDLLAFGDGDDVKVISAGSLVNFSEGNDLVRDGVTLLDDMSFQMGEGNDFFIFEGQSPSQAYLSFVDIFGGAGEDVVVVALDGGTEAMFHGGQIDTGAQSDVVILHAEFGIKGWMTGDILTGSGHDVVDISLASTAADPSLGGVLITGSIDLGTGDDRLNMVVDAGLLYVFQKIDFNVYAGAGDDYLNIDLSALGPAAVISAEQDPYGVFADLYRGGFEGSIQLGDGNDVLELALADASGPVTGAIYGDTYPNDGGYDTLILHHLAEGDVSVDYLDSYLGEGIRIVDGQQTLEVYGFEEIILGDGTDLLA